MSSITPSDALNKNNEYHDTSRAQPFSAADLILYYLEQLDIDFVFGIPGGSIEPLYNALARSQRRGGPRPVVARHETGAAFMADGYARETGKLGVCCATTGPGATNMITGVASAYQDQVPILAITAQTPLRTFGRGAVQESSCTGINTVAMYEHCTRYNTLVSHVDQLERKLISAITIAMQPPCGPVHLSIPLDVLREPVNIEPGHNLKSLLYPSFAVDDEAVDQLQNTLRTSRNAVFVLGAGAGKAVGTILEIAVLLNAHVITTPHGKGLISAYHPQYRGVYGLAGHPTAHGLLKDPSVDVVLAIGTDLDEQATNSWDHTALMGKKVVFIDSTPQHFSRSPMARQHISGNLRSLFERLIGRLYSNRKDQQDVFWQFSEHNRPRNFPVVQFERRASDRRHLTPRPHFSEGVTALRTKENRQELDRRRDLAIPQTARRFALKDEDKYLSNAIPIKPQRLMYDLSRLFPPTTRFLADIGNSFLWVIHYLHPYDRRIIGDRALASGLIRLGMGFASMGWAIGAAVGTAVACPGNPVVCIAGDGAVLMSGQELNTAVQEKLPIIYVILNDAAFGTVKHGQQMAGAEPIAFELPPIDFVAYAKSMGADGYRIDSPQDMAALDIAALCNRAGPTVLDVHIDPHERPPLEQRIKMLNVDANA